jgi:O-antigen ligase
MALIATLIFVALIIALIRFTREPGVKVSAAVWIAFAWLWFASSRGPSQWLTVQTTSRVASTAYSEGNAIDRNLLGGLMLLGVLVLTSRAKITVAFLAANIPAVLFFGYCLLSVRWSDHPDISWRRWFRGIGDLVMVTLILTEPDWVRGFRWIYVRLACVLLPLSILFFRFYPSFGRNYNIHDGQVSMTGVTDDKNALGMIAMLFSLAVGAGILDALRSKGRQRKQRLIGYSSVCAMGVYIVAGAHSATAVACLVLGGGVMFLASKPKIAKRAVLVHGMVAAVLSVSALSVFADTGLLQLLGRNPTLTGRTMIWERCLSIVTNPLLGAGYENFWLGSRLAKMWEYIYGFNQAHNGYLEIYLNRGWVGVALLVTILVAGYRNIFRAVRRGEPGANLRLAYFVVACVYNVTEAGFKMVHPMWIVLLFVSAAPAPRWPRVARRPLVRKPDLAMETMIA